MGTSRRVKARTKSNNTAKLGHEAAPSDHGCRASDQGPITNDSINHEKHGDNSWKNNPYAHQQESKTRTNASLWLINTTNKKSTSNMVVTMEVLTSITVCSSKPSGALRPWEHTPLEVNCGNFGVVLQKAGHSLSKGKATWKIILSYMFIHFYTRNLYLLAKIETWLA